MSAPVCPCGSGRPYEACCEPYHLGGAARTAKALMRSRYSAFARRLAPYLLRTWHPETRPAKLDLADGMTWRTLQLVDVVRGGADDAEGVVEFRASFRDASGAVGRLHERSRFARADGRWTYVDGDILD